MEYHKTDILIIGGGNAGMMAAELLSYQKDVTVVTKATPQESNSTKAQGGIAAAVAEDDHWSNHLLDTLVAGDYHNHEETTRLLVQKGESFIRRLSALGVSFDRDHQGNLSLGKEGAHGKRRILHAGGDAIGQTVMTALIQQVKPKIKLRESESLIELVVDEGRCTGAITKNSGGIISLYKAEHTILASGGAGQLYRITSNDSTITGDGIAAAYRAGVALADMEFVQFHPTMLTIEQEGVGLISEAVRGEGARLISEDGRFIMDGVHEQRDLAPRNVVAQAIHHTLLNDKGVFLDISMIPDFSKRFPTVTNICAHAGIDVSDGLLPVSPGAHFLMGGIVTDTNGRTNLPGLYAVGETACTGVHGANRLASNSLLEGLVFANETAQAILAADKSKKKTASWLPFLPKSPPRQGCVPSKSLIQEIMTKYVGIVREKSGLAQAQSWFEQYMPFCNEIVSGDALELIERINLLTVGWLITTSALERTESRGGHFRKDYPNKSKQWRGLRITRKSQRHTVQFEQRSELDIIQI